MPLEGYVYTILLTAREGKANVIEGLAARADDYLTKPPDDNELRARLNTGRRILKLEQSLRAANRRIQLLSITDALTGAYNRRHLMDRLPQEIERGRRYDRYIGDCPKRRTEVPPFWYGRKSRLLHSNIWSIPENHSL
jgi:PleD family two-component response regulator